METGPAVGLSTGSQTGSNNRAQWIEDAFSDYGSSQIGGSLTVSGLRSCWVGGILDRVRGSMTIARNQMADPDAMEFTTNIVRRNLSCHGNSPKVQFGDGDGRPNLVGRHASGECGFRVILLSPPPSAHIPVKPNHLHRRAGAEGAAAVIP